MTQDQFDKLLAFLDPDRDLAARKYEIIRKKLITFFQCRGCSAPEDYTDLTFNRVAKRIDEGVEIYATNPLSFFYGVARKVLQEPLDNLSRKSISLDDPSVFTNVSQDPAEVNQREAQSVQLEQELECLERCLKRLPSKNRDLILRYYQGETSVKINNRKKIAEQLGIPLNALRIRALRIREKLQDCVSNCVKN